MGGARRGPHRRFANCPPKAASQLPKNDTTTSINGGIFAVNLYFCCKACAGILTAGGTVGRRSLVSTFQSCLLDLFFVGRFFLVVLSTMLSLHGRRIIE